MASPRHGGVAQLAQHTQSQTKNLLVSYDPKPMGFFQAEAVR